ncbi:hypothetical protein Maeo_1231 [Methanococcus aeolicus Nankai-3]|uniref:Uncharacterized protein n=1 Tax=Methanococcus aeolicus (strain ATCC BAA-1280 / DSM 17508 / OCM 812 / Nankai-3) TaxID=419665 RepID=A6UWD5_META3|nr:hypothetical protein [Methanococcus aeolicus]ABR56807.1 hypothetical protein Maeo_1231 [Methanococcus aeolicus Nankai-3]
MNNEKKKIFLYIFIIVILNTVFFAVLGHIWYMVFILISLVVGYFALYPDEFFLIIDNAKNHAQEYIRNRKNKHAVENNSSVEDKEDVSEGYEEKRDIKKIDENGNKRNNLPLTG